MYLLPVSFIAGMLTVLAPCVFPLLPAIIGGSVRDGSHAHRPFVIVSSLVISIVLFTLLLKASTLCVSTPPHLLAYISASLLTLVGLTYIFPSWWSRVPGMNMFSVWSNKLAGKGMFMKKGFAGDVIIGIALGLIFSSCSPTYFVIIATVLPVHYALGALYITAYALGLGGVLLLVSFLGQKMVDKLEWATHPDSWLRKAIGILFIVLAIGIATGTDLSVQDYLVGNDHVKSIHTENSLLDFFHIDRI